MAHTEPDVIRNIDELDDPLQSMNQPNSRKRYGALSRVKGNVVLVIMAAASTGAVGLLAVRSRPQAASAEETQAGMRLEATIAMLDGPVPGKDVATGTITRAFYCDSPRRQIPMTALTGNPFVFRTPRPKAATTRPSASNSRSANRPNGGNDTLLRAMRDVNKLKLDSVLVGPRGPVAMISDNLLAQGQKVSGWTVSQIHPLEVVLTWRNRKRILRIPE